MWIRYFVLMEWCGGAELFETFCVFFCVENVEGWGTWSVFLVPRGACHRCEGPQSRHVHRAFCRMVLSPHLGVQHPPRSCVCSFSLPDRIWPLWSSS